MEASQITPPQGPQVGDKGLKKDALGFVSSLVIGVASTAPGYSLAATLGFIVAVTGIGLQAPAVLLVSFIPMLLIAAAYYYMNRADPDCGTTFSWVTRAMGPSLGWLGGWAIIVADIIVMANLAQIAGLYSFLLVDWQSAADSTVAVTAVGIVWIAIMTAIATIGIELSAKTQVGLLGAEVITLVLFAVVALAKVAFGTAPPTAVDPEHQLVEPVRDRLLRRARVGRAAWRCSSTGAGTARSPSTRRARTPRRDRARRRSLATVILLAIYIVVSFAAQAFAGPQELIDNADDVLSVAGQRRASAARSTRS